MKTNILGTALMILALSTTAFAQAAEPVRATSTKRSALERELDRALNKHLTYPATAKTDMTGEVYVSFVIDKQGRLEVLECNSANNDLKEYVLRKLQRIDIGDNPDGVWKTTHLRIAFRPERSMT
jgi:hypothetical protein